MSLIHRPPRPAHNELGSARTRRGSGQFGSAMVAALVFLFAFTSAGVIWLSRDVNRVVGNRSAAQSIAFQSARAGAQQLDLAALRTGGRVRVEAATAADAAFDAGAVLMKEYGVSGQLQVSVDGDRVSVTVTLADPVGDQTATGTVQARTGP